MSRLTFLALFLLVFLGASAPALADVCGGFAGVACGAKQFCDFPDNAGCGVADQQGQCQGRPEQCTQHVDPVCGCDGKTYNNACHANQAGVDVDRKGTCATALCPSGSYAAHTIPVGTGPAVVLTGRVTLPTSGWVVRLEQRPERILPPMFNFVCEKPAGIVLQVVTEYTASSMVAGASAGDQLSVTDETGETLVPVSPQTSSAVGTAKCQDNADCKGDKEYCAKKRCGKEGVCREKPGQCPFVFLPVAACTGDIHPNACVANSKGESVDKRVEGAVLRAR